MIRELRERAEAATFDHQHVDIRKDELLALLDELSSAHRQLVRIRDERDQARIGLVAAMQTIEAASLALGGNTGHGDREQLEQPGELGEVDRG